ncbi:NOL1/NOP2/sun family protein [Eremomyces bilateralis CBS 781.70]|uniref:NOL1/NOP2/sun family protein n=1 Tax=Eremomyces bilateralis CBS 781.70 TaxID=1392243 RepID=A0A6G1FSL9_9PEZI|nr:NOL1/NOP2/sun family protein [Eremomyces bilateralis CBS 781.70]KAF1808681.1 NOL1/NOP2/sun family protein [Eremomyces bilateralis CBS 781.70]
MGRRGGKRGNWGGKGRRGGGGGGQRAANYDPIEKKNELFEKYYGELGLFDGPEDVEAFWTALRRELPNSFRFAGSKGHALTVQERLVSHYIPEIKTVELDGQLAEPPKQLPWYPENLAWEMKTPKNVVRRYAPFASFQKFLVSETSVGNISRQEVVSMIPPLLLDVRPGMTVLDLCAAPGSKSAQLIEMIHGGEEARVRKVMKDIAKEEGREASPDGIEAALEQSQLEKEDDWSDDGRPTGLLIANDVDYKRAHMLIHQAKRLNSANLIVTNHDATMFPSIQLPSAPGQSQRYLKYDRILADVPCSGDGTARKNPGVWRDWIPANGLGLHTMQARILVRALQMLKVGGRVVYSTCSMNPVENEAVVAHAIERCGGLQKVELVDCSDQLPELKRRPGLTDWKVMDRNGEFWGSWEEYEKGDDVSTTKDTKNKVIPEVFPPVDSSPEDKVPLERCVRLYPHLQDTGGFFVAVLEKKSEIRALPEGRHNRVALLEQQKKKAIDGTASEKAVKEEEPANGAATSPLNGDRASTKRTLEDPSETVQDETPPKKQRVEEEPSDVRTEKTEEQPTVATEAPIKAPAASTNGHAAPEDSKPTPAGLTGTASAILKSQDTRPPRKSNQPFEEPFIYISPHHAVVDEVYEFYHIAARFPRTRFMVRNATGEPAKSIYYTSQLAKDILSENQGRGMKFVHCGVKMFQKQDAQGRDVCRWRIQSEGLPIIDAWVGEERVVRLYHRETLRKLLKEMFPTLGGEKWRELGEIGEKARDMSMGCFVLRVEQSEEEDGFQERMAIPLWRSINSINLMLPKEDRKAMLLRLYNDDSPLIDLSKERYNQINKPEDSPSPIDVDAADPATDVGADEKNADAKGGALSEDEEDGGVPLKGCGASESASIPATEPSSAPDVGENQPE